MYDASTSTIATLIWDPIRYHGNTESFPRLLEGPIVTNKTWLNPGNYFHLIVKICSVFILVSAH